MSPKPRVSWCKNPKIQSYTIFTIYKEPKRKMRKLFFNRKIQALSNCCQEPRNSHFLLLPLLAPLEVSLIFKTVFVLILTYGHESWEMTERVRSQVQASEMRFLRRVKVVTLFHQVCSSEIRKSLNIEPLLLRIERSQLRCVRPCKQNASRKLPKQALFSKENGKRRPRTRVGNID